MIEKILIILNLIGNFLSVLVLALMLLCLLFFFVEIYVNSIVKKKLNNLLNEDTFKPDDEMEIIRKIRRLKCSREEK